MFVIIASILIALKLAGVGNFSWFLPIIILIADFVISIAIHCHKANKIGSDWHKGMFD